MPDLGIIPVILGTLGVREMVAGWLENRKAKIVADADVAKAGQTRCTERLLVLETEFANLQKELTTFMAEASSNRAKAEMLERQHQDNVERIKTLEGEVAELRSALTAALTENNALKVQLAPYTR